MLVFASAATGSRTAKRSWKRSCRWRAAKARSALLSARTRDWISSSKSPAWPSLTLAGSGKTSGWARSDPTRSNWSRTISLRQAFKRIRKLCPLTPIGIRISAVSKQSSRPTQSPAEKTSTESTADSAASFKLSAPRKHSCSNSTTRSTPTSKRVVQRQPKGRPAASSCRVRLLLPA